MGLIKTVVTKLISIRVMIPATSRAIFVYHDVSVQGSPQYSELYSTEPRMFGEQIAFIKKHFEILPLGELLTASSRGRRLAAITFDDGFVSVRQTAMPVLAAEGIPFAVFVNRAGIEGNHIPYDRCNEICRRYEQRVFLDERDIRHLHERGVLIGSHSSTHRTLAGCDERTLFEEVAQNKHFLEDLLGQEIAHFAIPYGKREHYDDRALAYCWSSGHRYVYSSNPIYFKAPWRGGTTTPIPRIGLLNESPAELCFLLNRPMLRRIDI